MKSQNPIKKKRIPAKVKERNQKITPKKENPEREEDEFEMEQDPELEDNENLDITNEDDDFDKRNEKNHQE